MSKLACKCGHVISDTTDNIPRKGHVLPDVRYETFFVWLTEETQSYVEAVQAGCVEQWFVARGYAQDYIDLKLSHGDVLHDHIHAQFCRFTRNMYECAACGRIHMETREDHHFWSYAPDNGKVNAILGAAPVD